MFWTLFQLDIYIIKRYILLQPVKEKETNLYVGMQFQEQKIAAHHLTLYVLSGYCMNSVV